MDCRLPTKTITATTTEYPVLNGPSQEPGTRPKLNGRKITKIVGVTAILAVSACVYLSPLPPKSGQSIADRGRNDCVDAQVSQADGSGASRCAIRGYGTGRNDDSVQDKSDRNNVNASFSDTVDGNESTRRRSNNPADSLSEQDISDASHPGMTLMEICALADGNMHCHTESYAGKSAYTGYSDRTSPQPAGSISGRVLTEDGKGVPGVTIVASPERLSGQSRESAETLRFWTTTDYNGAYSLQGLPDGEFKIQSSKAGENQPARIAARTGVDYADLIIPRSTSLVARGRIVTPFGEPLEGVTVLPILPGQASVLSNGSGDFYLPLILREKARAFAIRFQRPGFSDTILRIDQAEGAVDLSALEVMMEPVSAWTAVSGKVESDTGSPLSTVAVELRLMNGSRSYRSATNQDGKFEFPAVAAPAEYRLLVNGNDRFRDFEQALHVDPDLGEVDVIVQSYEYGKLTGQLLNSNGVPVPEFELVLRNEDSRNPIGLVTTERSGNFELAAAPAGSLVISSQSTPHLLVQGLEIAPGESQHVQLTLDWGEHMLQGTVTDSLGSPVPASQVILTWLSTSANGITSSATRRTASDAEGNFFFNNLGPGPHVVRVSAPGFQPVDVEHDLGRQGYDINIRLEHKVPMQTMQDRMILSASRWSTGNSI